MTDWQQPPAHLNADDTVILAASDRCDQRVRHTGTFAIADHPDAAAALAQIRAQLDSE